MKAICKAIRLSVLVAVISLIISMVSGYFYCSESNFLNTMIFTFSTGAFSSALVTLLLNIPAYMVAKKQVLEKIYLLVIDYLSEIDKVDYLYNEFGIEELNDYCGEIEKNSVIDKYSKASRGNLVTIETESLLLCKYKEEHSLMVAELRNLGLSDLEIDNFLFEEAQKKVEELFTNMGRVIGQYAELADVSLCDFDLALSDVEFIFDKNEYKRIREELYLPIKKVLDAVCHKNYVLDFYNKGENNKVFLLENILLLQKVLFNTVIEVSDDGKTVVVWNRFMDKVKENLEKFRGRIYKVEPEDIRSVPRFIVGCNNDVVWENLEK